MGPVPGEPTSALLGGRYELGECVGQGGMAQVYRARDALLQRTVAIKVMRADADALGSPERAHNEMRVLASLDHPSLVKLLDGSIVPGGPAYLVMEFVGGPTLAQQVADGPLSAADVAHLAAELASALHSVHSAGVVHRDVKPSNILLAANALPGRRFHAKLADFGVAYLLDSTHITLPGTFVGTAAYLAPEQVRGEPLTPAADIYALGLVLLESLTGERAYPHASGIGAVMARLLDPPTIPDHLGAEWTRLLSRMTSTDAAARPTAQEVAQSAFDIALAISAASALPPAPTASRTDASAILSVETLPLIVPVAAETSDPVVVPAASAATLAQPLPRPADGVPLTRRSSARRRKARWVRAGMLIGSAAAAAALVVGAGLWAGATEGGTPEIVADVPTAESPLPAEPLIEQEATEVVSTDGASSVAVVPATDVSDDADAAATESGEAKRADEAQRVDEAKRVDEAQKQAQKQAEDAAKQAEQAAKQAQKALEKAAEDERKRLEQAQKSAQSGTVGPAEKPEKAEKPAKEAGAPAGTR